ncbi:MAG: DUF438 domain-containing protein [Chloroflexota bacterium]
MDAALSKETKKGVVKDIIRQLHQGMSAEQAKERFEREVGNVTSVEIADIEQGLINEGISPEEIKKFCNVHALIFQSALEKAVATEVSPSHPVYLFKLENREVEKVVESIKQAAGKPITDLLTYKTSLRDLLQTLRKVDTHYERKEQLLFPFLEKHGFMGPSKVMWGKDNEVRGLLKSAMAELDRIASSEDAAAHRTKHLDLLLEEITGMIFKEENILFPTSLEKLAPSEWVDILKESDDIGYVFIKKPEETDVLVKELQKALLVETVVRDNAVVLPTGSINLAELMPLLNALPVDLTFVDAEDRVRYFSEGKSRIFTRTKSVIGRKVQNCHPPQSVDVVEKILASFKEGKRDSYDFWINFRGRLVYIRYLAVKDRDGKYLGTLEVTQDITDIKKLEGERRLIDERT